MPEDNNDLRTMIYSLQNETIELLCNVQKETKANVGDINRHLGRILPSASRQSLFLFPFTDSVNLNSAISSIRDIFLNQIIQIECSNDPNISVDYERILKFIDDLDEYDAFVIAEHIEAEYLQNDNHILKRIKSDCRRLIPLRPISPSSGLDARDKMVIKLKALKNTDHSLCFLESLGKLVDVTLNSTSPSKAKGIKVHPGQSYVDDMMRLYYFKNGNIRLVFNSLEDAEKVSHALEIPY